MDENMMTTHTRANGRDGIQYHQTQRPYSFSIHKIKREKERKKKDETGNPRCSSSLEMSMVHWNLADPNTSQHARTESKTCYEAVIHRYIIVSTKNNCFVPQLPDL